MLFRWFRYFLWFRFFTGFRWILQFFSIFPAFAVFAMWLFCNAFFAFHFALQLSSVGEGGGGGGQEEETTINGTRRSTQQTRKNMKRETRRISSVQQLPTATPTATSTRARRPTSPFHKSPLATPPPPPTDYTVVIYKIFQAKKNKKNGFDWRTQNAGFICWIFELEDESRILRTARRESCVFIVFRDYAPKSRLRVSCALLELGKHRCRCRLYRYFHIDNHRWCAAFYPPARWRYSR